MKQVSGGGGDQLEALGGIGRQRPGSIGGTEVGVEQEPGAQLGELAAVEIGDLGGEPVRT